MARGDHLIVHRWGYTHHGIDLGAGRIVHYGRGLFGGSSATVEVVSWDDFSGGFDVRVHDCPAKYNSAAIVARALSRLGERNYDVLENNCEHFVHWCRRGRHESWQAERLKCRVAGMAAKLAARATLQGVTGWAARSAVIGSLARARRSPAWPWLLAADAGQWAAERAVASRGGSTAVAQRVGRSVNLGMSAAIGAATGGVAGVAWGLGIWAAGEAAAARKAAAAGTGRRSANVAVRDSTTATLPIGLP